MAELARAATHTITTTEHHGTNVKPPRNDHSAALSQYAPPHLSGATGAVIATTALQIRVTTTTTARAALSLLVRPISTQFNTSPADPTTRTTTSPITTFHRAVGTNRTSRHSLAPPPAQPAEDDESARRLATPASYYDDVFAYDDDPENWQDYKCFEMW